MSNNYNSENTRPFYNTDTFDLCHNKGELVLKSYEKRDV